MQDLLKHCSSEVYDIRIINIYPNLLTIQVTNYKGETIYSKTHPTFDNLEAQKVWVELRKIID